MRDRALAPDTRGWGRSVHSLQKNAASSRPPWLRDDGGGAARFLRTRSFPRQRESRDARL